MVSLLNPGHTAGKPKKRLFRFAALMAVLVLVFFAGLFFLVRSDYRRTVDESQQQLNHIAELFEQSVESSLNTANFRMWALIDRMAQVPSLDTQTLDDAYSDVLTGAVRDIDQIDSLVMIAPDGEVFWSTARPLIGRNLRDRGYFQKALTLERGEYAVGIPIISRATSRRVTPIAWPLLATDGTLRGVVASSMGEEYFGSLLTLTDIDSDMQVSIVTEDGAAAFMAGNLSGDFTDGLLEASAKVPSLGVTINVKRDVGDVLAAFRLRTVIFTGTAALLFFTVIGAAINLQIKQIQLAQSLARSEHDKRRILGAQKEFEAIFENVADGIVVFGEGQQFHRSNRKAREFLNAGGDSAAVARLRGLLPSMASIRQDVSIHRIELGEAGEGDGTQTIQCRLMKLNHHDQIIHYCVLADVSAEERLSEARAGFVTSVNHELRTPLTSLAGSLEVLSERFAADLPTGASRLVAMATRNADRLLMLVNDILTLQAIDQQQLSVQMEQVNVAEALAEAVATNTGYGLGAQVTLTCDTPDIPDNVFIQADRSRLQQIFSNLISNAVKYSPRNGEVRIGARLDGGMVEFHVRDSGPGIPEAARDWIFERFAKPVHEKGTQASGTGLGLAITRELALRQDAGIDFTSVTMQDDPQNSGTVFTVTFKETTPERVKDEAVA